MRLFIVLLLMGFYSGSALSANDFCQTFKKGIDQLRSRGAEAKRLVDATFSTPSGAAKSFAKSWYYLDLGEIVFPVPEMPTKLERQADGTIVINSPLFTALIGPDVLKQELTDIGHRIGSTSIHSDYDFNLFTFGKTFTSCNDIKNAQDADKKLKLATAKSVSAPFEIQKVLHYPKAQAIVLTGPRQGQTPSRGPDKKFATNLIVKKSAQTSYNAMIFFAKDSDQAKFHSYLPKIREKKFFSSGQPLSFEQDK